MSTYYVCYGVFTYHWNFLNFLINFPKIDTNNLKVFEDVCSAEATKILDYNSICGKLISFTKIEE